MSGYVEAGYTVILFTLGSYSVSLVVRERAARRRLPPPVDGPREELRPGDRGRAA